MRAPLVSIASLSILLAAAGCGGARPAGGSSVPPAREAASGVPDGKVPASTAGASAAKPAGFACDFDGETALRLPAGFSFLTAGPVSSAGVWKVEEIAGACSGRQVLTCSLKGGPEADRLGLSADNAPADGVLSVRLRADGAGAQGGMVFRYQDVGSHLLLLVDPAAGSAALFRVADGSRTQVAKGSFAPAEGWRLLSIECRGSSIQAFLDGAELLSAREKAPASGQAGLAARGTGKVLFDDLVAEAR